LEREQRDDRDGGEDVSGCAVACRIVFERERGERDTEPQLDASNHLLRHDACEPTECTGHGEDQHCHADHHAASRERSGRQSPGEHHRGHRLEGLHRHRQAVHEARGDLHGPEQREDARCVELAGDDERDQQG